MPEGGGSNTGRAEETDGRKREVEIQGRAGGKHGAAEIEGQAAKGGGWAEDWGRGGDLDGRAVTADDGASGWTGQEGDRPTLLLFCLLFYYY